MGINMYQKTKELYESPKLPWIIICIGIALRLIRYIYNPSIWFDESVYASDIISRDLIDFINPSPDYTTTSSYGFNIFVKLASHVFGNSEYALRLVPLFFGIISLFLFYKVSKHFISPKAVPVALGLFSVLQPLVYYSSELKPYSGDVAIALLIVAAATYIHTETLSIKHIFLLAVVGLVAIVFSNPSIFVLAGVGTGLLLSGLKKKEWIRVRGLLIIGVIWLLSFTAFYFMYTHRMTSSFNVSMEELLRIENGLMPFPPKSLADIQWFMDTLFDTFLFQDPIIYVEKVTLSGIMAFAFLIGGISMFCEKREKCYLLILPVLFTFIAAALHQYPFKGRQILFLAPLFLLVISEGVEVLREKTSKESLMIGIVFIGLVFIHPVSWAAYHAIKPVSMSQVRSVLHNIENNWQDGDIIYVHFFAQYEMDYYLKYHPEPLSFEEDDYIVGIAPRGWYTKWRKNNIPDRYKNIDTQSREDLSREYIKDMEQLRNHKRVWILFTGDNTKEKFFLSHLDTMGKRLDSFGRSVLGVTYLYDLTN